MADGSIRVETKLDTDGVEAGLDDIEKMCEDTKKHLEEAGEKLKLDAKLNVDTSEVDKVTDNVKSELEKIAEALDIKVKPVSVVNENGLNKAQRRLEEIKQEIEKIQAETDEMLPKAITDEQAVNLLKLEEIETKKLIAEQKELNRAIDEYSKKKTEAAGIKQAKLAQNQYKSGVKEVNADVKTSLVDDGFISKIKTAEDYDAALARIRRRMAQIEAETNKLSVAKGIDPEDALRTNKEYQKLKAQLEALNNSTKKFKRISDDSFRSARKSADSMGDGIKKAIRTMTKYTLTIFGARSAFMAIKGVIGDDVSENEKLNRTVNAMKGALSYALTPAIEKVVYYIEYGLAYLNLFIKTLTGVDIVAGYNAEALKKQAEATKETAKAAKEAKSQLAGFDEKNMLSSNTASSGSTGVENAASTLELPDVSGGKFEMICEDIKKHIHEVSVLLGVSLVAVGFILLACGQIPMGLAAVIAGIALVAVTIKKWDSLSNETKKMISTILGIASAAFLVIGIILLCTGVMIPLGIALIVAGIAGLVAVVALNWDAISTAVKNFFEPIKKYLLGGFEIVFGVLLCFVTACLPLGIALIKKGIKTMVSEEQPNKENMKKNTQEMMEDTKRYLLGGMEIVFGVILCLSVVGFPLGLAMIRQGVAAIKSEEPVDKEFLKKNASDFMEDVKRYLLGGLEIVFGVILCLNVAGLPLGIAMIRQGVAAIKSEEPVDKEFMKKNASDVMEDMKKYLLGGFEIVFGVLLCCTVVGLPLGIALIKDGIAVTKSEEPLDETAAQSAVGRMWANVKNFWNSNIRPVFTAQWWKTKFSAITEGAKAALNATISVFEKGINWIVGKVNSISVKVPDKEIFGSLSGMTIGFNIPYVSIPRLARGGIVNNPGTGQHIIAGEAGAEAVLPLENNTEWMNILAEKIAERISIPIVNKFYVDSKEVSVSHNKNQERFTFATNGGVL